MDKLNSAIAVSVKDLVSIINHGENPDALGLRRSSRLPVLAALYSIIKRPILLITDRYDRVLTLADELNFWLPDQKQCQK